MGNNFSEREWQDSVLEAVCEADFKYLATVALAVPLLISSKVDSRPVWGQWRYFCQIEQETETKLTYFRGLNNIGSALTNKLIKAGILIMVEPKEAGMIIRETANLGIDADSLAISAALVTIYSLVGINHYRREVIAISGMGKEELWDRLRTMGIKPDRWTVDRLALLFGQLPEYL